jgi:5-oxoprolinase (ATP-hydrolysing)
MTAKPSYQFWVDRGGTFTDVIARKPDGSLATHKLLSDNPQHYDNAAIEGIRVLLGVPRGEPLPVDHISAVKMGTTVATNTLLERKGEPTALITTVGFADALRIGYQARPNIFALDIVLPEMLYTCVVEVDERMHANGTVLRTLDETAVRAQLAGVRDAGFDSVAICFMHGYRYTDHERRVAAIARSIGFGQVSVSHEVSPLMKLVSRGDTTVVDAYLAPVLRRYVDDVETALHSDEGGTSLLFMQSNGGLTKAGAFRGKDALLSGPAGGVVGMIRTAANAGYHRLIGFDMGGTSTDVSHYAGELERTYESTVAGVRVRAPMMDIHTVAAGGGSILHFDGQRMRVGPDSAGANPGPVSYRKNGPLTVTDCNVLLGKLRPEYFPAVFGSTGNEPLDVNAVREKFAELTTDIERRTGTHHSSESVAEGFLTIAVESMANAIKKVSVERGHDVTGYTLVCFGGAGGQHACLIADRLSITRVLVHPLAGVLSALGIGLAEERRVSDLAVEATLTSESLAALNPKWSALEAEGVGQLASSGIENIEIRRRLAVRYAGSDTALFVNDGDLATIGDAFQTAHHARFGFVSRGKPLVIESIHVEAIGLSESTLQLNDFAADDAPASVSAWFPVVFAGSTEPTPFIERGTLSIGRIIDGPAVILDANATTAVEPGWQAKVNEHYDLVLERVVPLPDRVAIGTSVDPVQLEIFNKLFMNIAEQMGLVLANVAASVNIKERLDFSCAIFDPLGDLIANAPHMPVHLGSMGESVRSIITQNPTMRPGSVYVMNAPYNGGTHLPDITVIKPVFGPSTETSGPRPIFYVASRGHHADVGGTVPGSAPADSTTIEEEGILLDNVLLVDNDHFLEQELRNILGSGAHPARNIDQNIGDLKAQVAACEKGATELHRVVQRYGLDVVHAYMSHVQDNAEESVRRVIEHLHDATFTSTMDDGNEVCVTISVDRANRCAMVDFTGTSGVHPGNYNAPRSIAQAATLYVFRTLVNDDIPLNAGCMKPLTLVVPDDSIINPSYPAAVFAGNVETSQVVVDTIYGALGVMGAAQGTMNNLIWGNDTYQYYETICGGAGATANADGCSAVQTHMTNSRLTDPEVLEWRYPVVLEAFHLRHGSGGNGQHRGGDGVVRRLRFEEAMEINVLAGHRRVAPYGAAGGNPGRTGANRTIGADGTVTEFGATFRTFVKPGDRFEIETPGGGGFGTPCRDRT